MSVPAPVRASVQFDQLNREVMIINSAMRLGSGGRARFARDAINHQAVIRGKTICSPRASTIVRLCVRS